MQKTDIDTTLKSIAQYQKTILSDINLSLRIYGDNETIYITRIEEWVDTQIYFNAPIYKGDLRLYHEGDQLEVYMVTQCGIYHTELKILSQHTIKGNVCYKSQIIRPIIKQQNREYFRLSTLLQLQFSLVNLTTEEVDITQYPKLLGMSVNISAGGLCMVTKTNLEPLTHLYLYFDILDTQFELIGQVLESGTLLETGNLMYRIKFIDVPSQTQDLISKLIFQKQRLERSSSLNA